MFWILLSLLLLTFVLSFGLNTLLIRWSEALGMVDRPNERSSHSVEKPKGGGLGIFIAMTAAMVAAYELGLISVDLLQPLLFGGPAVVVIGWLDDKASLRAGPRLVVHLLVSLFIFLLVTDLLRIPYGVPFVPAGYDVLAIGFSVLCIAWFINLYNFMDGADGMAGGTGLAVCLFLGGLSYYDGFFADAVIYALMAVSIFGFLILNWAPAKIFMGDTGAYYLGFLFSVMALIMQFYNGTPLHYTVIPLGAFIVDATGTLLIRGLRRQQVFKAHRQFAFQKAMIIRGWSHQRVSLLYMLVTIFWLFPMTLLVRIWPAWYHLILVVSYLPLIAFFFYHKAGTDRV